MRWQRPKLVISDCQLAEGEEKPDNEGKIKCPSLFLASADSACDVRKTHRPSMCGIQHVPGYRENVIRASGQGYGFKTTGQEQNRSIRKGHLTQQKKRDRESRLGVSKGYSRWHLVLAKLLSPIYWAYPLINKAEKQIQLSKVIVDNSLCFVHVWGNKSANYTGVDINGAPLKQRLSSERNTFPDELCIVPLLYHHVCRHHVHVHSVKNFLSTAN